MKYVYRLLHLCYRGFLSLRGVVRGGTIVAVQMVIKTDTHVLLVRPTYRTHWEFPGGAVDAGESPEDAGIRESYEEARIRVEKIEKKIGVFSFLEHGTTVGIHLYLAEVWHEEGKWKPGWEIRERKFFPLYDLPCDISDFAREIIGQIS